MMRKIFLSFFVFLFLIFYYSSYSQTITCNINWKQNFIENISGNKIVLMTFEENNYYRDGSQIPIFVNYIKLENDNKEAIFLDYRVEIIPEEILQDINTKNIDEDFEFNSKVIYNRKQPYLYVELFPVRYNKSIKKYERILTFSFKIVDMQKKYTEFNSEKTSFSFASNSVLSSGKWKKIKITQTGIYKLTFNQIRDLGFSNPSNIKVYGNGGAFLGYYNNKPRIDDLVEIPIYVHLGNDGIFNEGDYILFYAKSPVYWNYDVTHQAFIHSLHPYTNESYYFLTDYGNSATIISSVNYDTLIANRFVTTFDDYNFHEQELHNFLKSGRLWVGESFNYSLTQNFSFNFQNVVPNSTLFIQSAVYSQSNNSSSFSFSVNGSNIGNQSVYGSGTSGTAVFGEVFRKRINNSSNQINISVTYNKPASGGSGWLDYIVVNVRRYLNFSGGQMIFRDASSVGINNVAEFQISTSKSNAIVWDVTSATSPFVIETTYQNNILSFKAPANEIREYVVFDGSNFLSPVILGDVPNQNLHALSEIDLIIISHKNFLSAANELADIHRNYDNLKVVVVTPEQVYNEFSSGMPDVSAIKFFMKMLYERAGNDSLKMPKYLLLFGDGSFNNRNNFAENTNFIISYQSANSLSAVNSLTTDDYFGLLDDNEYEYIGTLDIGVGRIPVKTLTEAQNVVKKIRNYYSSQSLGEWRNWIAFLADDEDVNEHIAQANALAQYLENNFQQYIIDKIYLDAFPQKTTPTGDRYPDANEAVNQRMKKGCLVFNYTGHGNEYALTHEHVIIISDIVSWSNFNTLPLFVTATCEFGRWDDYTRVSAGELVYLNPRGGAINMLTTTRLVYSTSNFALNKAFFETMFPKNAQGEYLRLGDVYRLSKNRTGGLGDINKRNFSLIGDPAMRIAFPKFNVLTDSINSMHISQFNDTIRPLQKVRISGHVENDNNVMTSFNGEIFVTVLDKPTNLITLANDGGNPYQFSVQKDILFRGKASVNNGYFNCEFIVPKDIKYTTGFGKISYYAVKSGTTDDATGSFNHLLIGGEQYELNDNKGPEINLFMNSESFVDGGITNQSPTLIVKLFDENGINTVSSSIGHDITAILDNNPSKKYILNENYISEKDNYKKGIATYTFSNLEPGEHTVTVKAWDVANNSSEKSLRFVVKNSEELVISRLVNYPNPFTTKTQFYFEHNSPNSLIEIKIQIFTVTGKIVKTIQTQFYSDDFRSPAIEWDCKDDYGDVLASGVYFYKVHVKVGDKTFEKMEKMVKLK